MLSTIRAAARRSPGPVHRLAETAHPELHEQARLRVVARLPRGLVRRVAERLLDDRERRVLEQPQLEQPALALGQLRERFADERRALAERRGERRRRLARVGRDAGETRGRLGDLPAT